MYVCICSSMKPLYLLGYIVTQLAHGLHVVLLWEKYLKNSEFYCRLPRQTLPNVSNAIWKIASATSGWFISMKIDLASFPSLLLRFRLEFHISRHHWNLLAGARGIVAKKLFSFFLTSSFFIPLFLSFSFSLFLSLCF